MRREFPPRRGLYAEAGTQFAARFNREWPAHSIRTAIAAIGSLYIARLVGLPEAYWATITTVVVMQSTLGVALTPSRTVFVGTALGAAAATYFGASTVVFTLGIFVLGLVCALLRLDRNDYRFAGSTLAIVVLVSHEKAGWVAALQRFVEVSIGIGVGPAGHRSLAGARHNCNEELLRSAVARVLEPRLDISTQSFTVSRPALPTIVAR